MGLRHPLGQLTSASTNIVFFSQNAIYNSGTESFINSSLVASRLVLYSDVLQFQTSPSGSIVWNNRLQVDNTGTLTIGPINSSGAVTATGLKASGGLVSTAAVSALTASSTVLDYNGQARLLSIGSSASNYGTVTVGAVNSSGSGATVVLTTSAFTSSVPVIATQYTGSLGAIYTGTSTSTPASSTVVDYSGGARLLSIGSSSSSYGQVTLGALNTSGSGATLVLNSALLSSTVAFSAPSVAVSGGVSSTSVGTPAASSALFDYYSGSNQTRIWSSGPSSSTYGIVTLVSGNSAQSVGSTATLSSSSFSASVPIMWGGYNTARLVNRTTSSFTYPGGENVVTFTYNSTGCVVGIPVTISPADANSPVSYGYVADAACTSAGTITLYVFSINGGSNSVNIVFSQYS